LCVAPPLPVEGFAIGLFWHERSDGHAGFKWVREFITRVADSRASDYGNPRSLTTLKPVQTS
ncbi:MAG: hypothetical protein ABS999_20265, partial [Pseudomonas atacamensis]